MNLFIDTTDFNKVTFAVSDGEKTQKKNYKIDPQKSYETISKLDEFLVKLKVQPHLPASSPRQEKRCPIKKIYVNKGPGSYTGTRVGVTIAQAMGFAWKVPVKFMTADALIKNGFRR